MFFRLTALLFFCLPAALVATSPRQLQALYSALDTRSISEQLAYHQLYPESPQGKKALENAWSLMAHETQDTLLPSVPENVIDTLIDLFSRSGEAAPKLDEPSLATIEKISAHLPHKRLKGHSATTEEEVLALSDSEIDCARAVLLSQFHKDLEAAEKIRQYEATLDMIALQIAAKLPKEPTPQNIIDQINHTLFHEMYFRFPPHSTYAKDIDLYTFLPSVMDSRRGVCLGVSVLYLSLAQRLNLPLEIVTPPGHIYLRYNDDQKVTNIETTARGIHLPDDVYLSVNLHTLPLRHIKEVPGLVAFNQASVYLQEQNFEKAAACYEQAMKYISDSHVKTFLGTAYLFVGQKEKGLKLLREAKGTPDETLVASDTLIDDLLLSRVAIDDARCLFLKVDEKRQSLLDKKEALTTALKRNPKFCSGHFQLAITNLQLHRYDEALVALKQYHKLTDQDPTAEYYLAALSTERYNYPEAWIHLNQAEKLTAIKAYQPRPLKQLHQQLTLQCPE